MPFREGCEREALAGDLHISTHALRRNRLCGSGASADRPPAHSCGIARAAGSAARSRGEHGWRLHHVASRPTPLDCRGGMGGGSLFWLATVVSGPHKAISGAMNQRCTGLPISLPAPPAAVRLLGRHTCSINFDRDPGTPGPAGPRHDASPIAIRAHIWTPRFVKHSLSFGSQV